MNFNCGCVIKYSVLVYSGMCLVLNKICRFKCGNNTKTETALKKTPYQASVHIRTEAKSTHMASAGTKTKAKRRSNFKKKIENKKHIWPQVEPKLRPKGDRIKKMKINSTYGLGWSQNRSKRSGSMASGAFEPRQKRALWLWFLSEAKSYPLLASPQYASVREPVQNIKNNRCQSSFLHW